MAEHWGCTISWNVKIRMVDEVEVTHMFFFMCICQGNPWMSRDYERGVKDLETTQTNGA